MIRRCQGLCWIRCGRFLEGGKRGYCLFEGGREVVQIGEKEGEDFIPVSIF